MSGPKSDLAPIINPNIKVRTIDESSIKFLAAGEKINDIETATRELVENAVDAGAKNIDIRLAQFGAESIEVSDNGTGIDECNFSHLGMRYHTSKITDSKSLQESLETFGFRGEALSCLCSIASVTILTRAKSSPTGWKLTFRKDGTIAKKESNARDVGTTVILKNLFYLYPVRRKELQKTAKKQYDKIVKLIYEQVLARPHIKFSLCRKTTATKMERDFTHGGTTLEGCLTTIFGSKILDSLLPIEQFSKGPVFLQLDKAKKATLQVSEIKSETQDVKVNAKLMTKISACPKTEPPDEALSDITTDASNTCASSLVCENEKKEPVEWPVLKPDPQNVVSIHAQVALADETHDTSITTLFEPKNEFYKRERKSKFRNVAEYKIHGYISKIGNGRYSSDGQFIFVNNKPCEILKLTRAINEIYRNYSNNSNQYPFFCIFIQVQTWVADFNVPRKRAVILQEENKLCDIARDSLEKMYSSYAPATQSSCPVAQIPKAFINILTRPTSILEATPSPNVAQSLTLPSSPSVHSEAQSLAQSEKQSNHQTSFHSNPRDSPKSDHQAGPPLRKSPQSRPRSPPPSPYPFPPHARPPSSPCPGPPPSKRQYSPPDDVCNETLNKRRVQSTVSVTNSSVSKERASSFDKCRFSQINAKVNGVLQASLLFPEDLAEALELERAKRKVSNDKRQFSFAIHPKFNTPAEEELKLNLDKKSFKEMQIIGQFNKGFIITRLNEHLFIIDQHATDERNNYEDQLEKSPLVRQTMVHPKPLYLNLIQENAILNHMESFVKRGFEFLVDKSKLIGYRVMLSSTSICKGPSKDEYLDKEDIEELIDVAIESPNRLETYILSKVRNVSASIACRKSVMIGDSLSWQQMSSIVEKMSDLKNPWVCAHNRPTIRHLMDVDWV